MIGRWCASLALLALLPLQAHAQVRCTQDVLNVRGIPVTIAYCVDGIVRAIGPDELAVPVYTTVTSPTGSFSRRRDLHFFAGEGISRVVENVRLERVGIVGVLHLTVAYATGAVIVEGAMLSPGGITIK